MTDQEAINLGLIAIETLKAVLEELGIDRSTLYTGSDVVNAVRRRVVEFQEGRA